LLCVCRATWASRDLLGPTRNRHGQAPQSGSPDPRSARTLERVRHEVAFLWVVRAKPRVHPFRPGSRRTRSSAVSSQMPGFFRAPWSRASTRDENFVPQRCATVAAAPHLARAQHLLKLIEAAVPPPVCGKSSPLADPETRRGGGTAGSSAEIDISAPAAPRRRTMRLPTGLASLTSSSSSMRWQNRDGQLD